MAQHDSVDGVGVLQGSPVTPDDSNRLTEYDELERKARWLRNAPGFVQNESALFDQMYDEFVTQYYAEATDTNMQGRQILRLFAKYKPMVRSFVENVLHNTEKIEQALDADLSWEPEGSGQAIVRPILVESYSDAAYANTPGGTGAVDLIPNVAGTETMGTGTDGQAQIIIGYHERYADGQTGYDQLQEDVNDSLGTRRPLYTQAATEHADAISVIERGRGPLPVFPGENLEIDLNVTQDGITTGLWPLGVEVVVATASVYGGPLD